MIFTTEFLVDKASMFKGSSLPLNNSLIDIFKFNSPNETNVSPSNGALLMITNFSIATLACGKLLNKLKSASANETFASKFSLMVAAIFAFISS